MRILLLIMVLFAGNLQTCKSVQAGNGEIIALWIASQKVDCQGVAPQTCYLVRESPEADWAYFYDEIDGFEYQPGYCYELRVQKIKVWNVPADASAFHYTLVEVRSKEIDPALRLHDIWALEAFGEEQIVTDGQRPYLELFPVEGRVLGFAGCNELQGKVAMDGENITFSPLTVIKKACPGLELEERFLRALERVDRFELDGLKLSLFAGNKLLLVLRKVD